MVTLNSFIPLMKFLLYFSSLLLLILVSCFPEKNQAWGSREANRENQFNTLPIGSLLPESVRRRHLTGSNTRKYSTTLEVVHRFGPYSLNTTTNFKDTKAYRPVLPGELFNTTDHSIVTISLGTPEQAVSLVLDTGSNLMWTPCKPIYYEDPTFDPFASTSFRSIPCYNSPLCPVLLPNHNCSMFNNTDTCTYSVGYADGSYSAGVFSMDKLTIIPSDDVFPDFLFGCGENNQGLSSNTTFGVLGFGRNDTLSFVSQTAETYGSKFSYCLSSTPSVIGYLKLGEKDVASSNNVRFTPLIASSDYPSFYFIEIISIAVGGCQLSIDYASVFKNPGIIMDSGTMITRLPPGVYRLMRDEFKKQMGNYPTAPAFAIFDTCSERGGNINYSTVSFTFNGNVTVDLHSYGVLVAVDAKRECFAFAEDSGLSIFGSTQQQTLEVVYDVAGGKLGFGPGGCG